MGLDFAHLPFRRGWFFSIFEGCPELKEMQLYPTQSPIIIPAFIPYSFQRWRLFQWLQLIKLSEEKLRAFLAQIYLRTEFRSPVIAFLRNSWNQFCIPAKKKAYLPNAVLIWICRKTTDRLIIWYWVVYPFTVFLVPWNPRLIVQFFMFLAEQPHPKDLISSFLPVIWKYLHAYCFYFMLDVNSVPLVCALSKTLCYLLVRLNAVIKY